MIRSVRRGVALAALLVAGLSVPMRSAFAQELPPIPPLPLPPVPAPTLPPQTQPVFELIAPMVYSNCGTAALVAFQVGSSYPGAGPPTLALTAPLFAICGAVPRPPQQYTCLIDAQIQALINAATSRVGVPLPLGLHPQGDVVEQTILVVDKLGPPASTAGLQDALPILFVCALPASNDQTGGDYSTAPVPTPQPPLTPVFYPPGSVPGYLPPPSVVQQPATQPTLAPPRSSAVGDAVIYAGVWLLPLALLFFGGYFGGALTRDIRLSPSRFARA